MLPARTARTPRPQQKLYPAPSLKGYAMPEVEAWLRPEAKLADAGECLNMIDYPKYSEPS